MVSRVDLAAGRVSINFFWCCFAARPRHENFRFGLPAVLKMGRYLSRCGEFHVTVVVDVVELAADGSTLILRIRVEKNHFSLRTSR